MLVALAIRSPPFHKFYGQDVDAKTVEPPVVVVVAVSTPTSSPNSCSTPIKRTMMRLYSNKHIHQQLTPSWYVHDGVDVTYLVV